MQKLLLEKIDIFAYQPSLYIQKQTRLRTPFGGLMTFFTFLVFIATFVYFGKDLFFKKNPSTIQKQEITNYPEEIQLNSTSFNFAFGIQDPKYYMHFMDETIYTVKIQNSRVYDAKNNETGEMERVWDRIYYTPVPCKKEYFQIEDTQDYFHNLADLDKMYCLNPKDIANDPVTVGGSYVNEYYSYINIYIYACQNTTESNNCQSQEIIDQSLNKGYYAIYYSEMILDPQNFEKPFSYYGKDYVEQVNLDTLTTILFGIENIYLETDNGYLWDSYSIAQGKQISESSVSVVDATSKLYTINRLSMKKFTQTRIYRSYTDLMTVSAQTGGIFKIFLIFFGVINYFYVSKQVNRNIIDSIYDFSYKNENQSEQQQAIINQNDQKKQKNEKKSNQNANTFITKKLKQDQEMKDKIFRHQVKPLDNNLTEEQIVVREKMLKIAQNKFRENLDAITISKKIEEIEKLKLILLNKQQRQVFDYLSSPVIFQEELENLEKQDIIKKKKKKSFDSNHKNEKIDDLQLEEQKLDKIYNSIKQIQIQPSIISQRLFNLLQNQKFGIEMEDLQEQETQYISKSLEQGNLQQSKFNQNILPLSVHSKNIVTRQDKQQNNNSCQAKYNNDSSDMISLDINDKAQKQKLISNQQDNIYNNRLFKFSSNYIKESGNGQILSSNMNIQTKKLLSAQKKNNQKNQDKYKNEEDQQQQQQQEQIQNQYYNSLPNQDQYNNSNNNLNNISNNYIFNYDNNNNEINDISKQDYNNGSQHKLAQNSFDEIIFENIPEDDLNLPQTGNFNKRIKNKNASNKNK